MEYNHKGMSKELIQKSGAEGGQGMEVKKENIYR